MCKKYSGETLGVEGGVMKLVVRNEVRLCVPAWFRLWISDGLLFEYGNMAMVCRIGLMLFCAADGTTFKLAVYLPAQGVK